MLQWQNLSISAAEPSSFCAILSSRDIVFGKHYEFFEETSQKHFNELYPRAIVCCLFLPFYPEGRQPETTANISIIKRLSVGASRDNQWPPLVSETLQGTLATDMFVRLLRASAADSVQCISGGEGSLYKAPMIALCNSSEMGKPRLSMSTASSCPSILICLHGTVSTAM